MNAIHSARAHKIKDSCAAALAMLVFLLLAEVTFRAAGVKFNGSFYDPNRELGYVLRPNAHGWDVTEYPAYFTVNSDGLSDREHAVPRPSGVLRIAIAGDSVSEAKHVPHDRAFWAVMGQYLNNHLPAGKQVEVINFGVAGYGLAQDYLVIQQRIWKYDPQIVLLAGTIESLTLRSTRALSPNALAEHVPFYVLDKGQMVPDAQTRQERTRFPASIRMHEWFGDLLNVSRVAALCNQGVKKIADQASSFRHVNQRSSEYRETDSFLGPVSPRLQAAWDASEALILQANAEVSRHHAEFWLFTLDMAQQVDPLERNRAGFQRRLGLDDLFLADHLLADFAARQGILHGTLAPEMQLYAQQHNIVLHGFPGTPRNTGHWNEAGHHAAGEAMGRLLMQASPKLRQFSMH